MDNDKLTYYDMIKIVSTVLNKKIKVMIGDMEDIFDFRPILFMFKTGNYISFSLTMSEQVELLVKYVIIYANKGDSNKYRVMDIDYSKVILNKNQYINIKGKKITVEDALNLKDNNLNIIPIIEYSFINTKFLENN